MKRIVKFERVAEAQYPEQVPADARALIGSLLTPDPALRLRVIRGWLLAGGANGLSDKQFRAVDALVTAWRGQGGVAIGGGVRHTRLFAERLGGTAVPPARGRSRAAVASTRRLVSSVRQM
jgi:tRNA(Ile)-lysidine synthase